MPATPRPAPGAACWRAWCDGSAAPNPGRMAWGVLIVAPDGGRHTLSGDAGSAVGCNNQAELLALARALSALQALGAREVLLHGDNSVVLAQLAPDAPPAPALQPLAAAFDQVRGQLSGFDRATLAWVPRHRNAEADALARAAAGLPPKAVLPPGRGPRRRR